MLFFILKWGAIATIIMLGVTSPEVLGNALVEVLKAVIELVIMVLKAMFEAVAGAADGASKPA